MICEINFQTTVLRREKNNLLSVLNVVTIEVFQLEKTENNFRIDFAFLYTTIKVRESQDSFALRLDRHDIRLNKQVFLTDTPRYSQKRVYFLH